jgi:hypothetical protein
MRQQLTRNVHPIACSCRRCAPASRTNRNLDLAIKAGTRVLFLIAALIAIPFIIAHALASAKSDRR